MLLHEALKSYNVILASQSPRRRDLLSGCGIAYTTADNYSVEECYPDTLPVEQVPQFLAQLKSDGYPTPLVGNDLLITADTVVILEGQILGKPRSREQALEMLARLSGRSHRVITGVVLRTSTRTIAFDATSEVFFKSLSEEEIAYYVDTYAPFDKAGSYGIQEWIGYVAIERIEGSFYNVMGLPIQKLYEQLKQMIQ